MADLAKMRAQIERAVGVARDPDYAPLTRAAADTALRLLDQLTPDPPHVVYVVQDGGLALAWSDERGRVALEIEVGPEGDWCMMPLGARNGVTVPREFARREMQRAWQRLDYATADAWADLLGEKRPSEHEAEGV